MGNLVYNELVTAPPLPLVWRVGELQRQQCELEAATRQAAKPALEDVEKIVRRHDREIDDLVETVCEIMYKLQSLGFSFTEEAED
jgi:hypothetical protein